MGVGSLRTGWKLEASVEPSPEWGAEKARQEGVPQCEGSGVQADPGRTQGETGKKSRWGERRGLIYAPEKMPL